MRTLLTIVAIDVALTMAAPAAGAAERTDGLTAAQRAFWDDVLRAERQRIERVPELDRRLQAAQRLFSQVRYVAALEVLQGILTEDPQHRGARELRDLIWALVGERAGGCTREDIIGQRITADPNLRHTHRE